MEASATNDIGSLIESLASFEDLKVDDKTDAYDVESDDSLKCRLCGKLYTDPRVLPCLHVFCTTCIVDLVNSALKEESGGVMECPTCQQRAALPDGGNVSCLPLDVVMLNARDVADVRRGTVECTGCMSHRNAVAHCLDCCAFLCQSCVSAHRLMHCFENHKVCMLAVFNLLVRKVWSHCRKVSADSVSVGHCWRSTSSANNVTGLSPAYNK